MCLQTVSLQSGFIYERRNEDIKYMDQSSYDKKTFSIEFLCELFHCVINDQMLDMYTWKSAYM